MKLRKKIYWKQTPSINYYEQQSLLSETIMAWISTWNRVEKQGYHNY